ncbi:PH domain-containing protein [Candidatus Uhrbacteria bacterium]|nr:PH domain-containing protein [Candidatus Uhrbacteria bacterium]
MMHLKELLHHKDERVVYFLRHHWIAYALPGAAGIVLALVPIIIGSVLSATGARLLDQWAGVVTILLSVYYLSIWLFSFTTFLSTYLDVWVVTTHRIVYIEQHSLFSRTIAEQPLFRVQDVTSTMEGVLPTLLGYGNIRVQTAGTNEQFTFKTIARPLDVSRTIFQLVEDVYARETKSTSS